MGGIELTVLLLAVFLVTSALVYNFLKAKSGRGSCCGGCSCSKEKDSEK